MRESTDVVLHRIARRVVRTLSAMRHELQSGDDSGLRNVWDEVCVQVQGEHSFYWWAYEETLHRLVEAEVERLPTVTMRTLWLETPRGQEWRDEEVDGRTPPPYSLEEVAELLNKTVHGLAENWSNRRIRCYLDRA